MKGDYFLAMSETRRSNKYIEGQTIEFSHLLGSKKVLGLEGLVPSGEVISLTLHTQRYPLWGVLRGHGLVIIGGLHQSEPLISDSDTPKTFFVSQSWSIPAYQP